MEFKPRHLSEDQVIDLLLAYFRGEMRLLEVRYVLRREPSEPPVPLIRAQLWLLQTAKEAFHSSKLKIEKVPTSTDDIPQLREMSRDDEDDIEDNAEEDDEDDIEHDQEEEKKAEPKRHAVFLHDRPPVSVQIAEWQTVVHDQCGEPGGSIAVHHYKNHRWLVTGNVEDRGYRQYRQDGELVEGLQNLVPAIRRVGTRLGFPPQFIDDVIHQLPPELI